jgi:NadR type nicotinamide-nucleotide adenylyltransferase
LRKQNNIPIKKIVVIGPESTGKSSLCEALARHYGVSWVPEYAREYLLQHGSDYRVEDLLRIARGQLDLEAQYARAAIASGHKLLFVDTDMYVMKVWSEFVFGSCDPWILTQIASRFYDAYLLCRPDLPWSPDPLREYPDGPARGQLFQMYKDCLVNQSMPWAEVGGQGEARIAAGIAAVEVFGDPSCLLQ